jgi:hypothetical protein
VSCFPPCSIKSIHIPRSCSQKLLPITKVVHQSFSEVPRCCFSAYKAVFCWHWCHHCAGQATVDYLSSPLRSCLGIVSLLYGHPLSLGIGTHSLSVSASLLHQYSTPQYWHPCSIGIPSLSVSTSLLPRYPHPCSLSIPILAPSVSHSSALVSPLSQYWHLLSLGISIPALSVSHSLVSASLTLWYLWYLASVSLSCIRTAIHDPASVSPSIGLV